MNVEYVYHASGRAAPTLFALLALLSIPNSGWAGDLDGRWTGSFTHDSSGAGQQTVPFSAVLKSESGGEQFTGKISEPQTFGEEQAPEKLSTLVAIVTGKLKVSSHSNEAESETNEKNGESNRTVTTVEFEKRYDGSGGVSYSVRYFGVFDKESGEIRGEWELAGANGPFTMTKSKGEEKADVPSGGG